jgi:RNA polymerase sigma factor (sigma-70 family)
VRTQNQTKSHFSGTVDIGKNRTLFVDTATGEGVEEICKLLKKFVYFQTGKTSFPSYSSEDVAQEVYALAIEAIPKYNPNKNANILTFLHNHVKNRIINLCKFHSEKRRISRYTDIGFVKLRCNSCRNFFPCNNNEVEVACPHCKIVKPMDSDQWKKYNIAVVPLSYNSTFMIDDENSMDGEASNLFDRDSDMAGFIVAGHTFHPSYLNTILDVEKAAEDLDVINKQIFKLIYQGFTVREVSEKIGINQRLLRIRLNKILVHMRNFLGDESAKKESSSLC